MDRAEGPWRRAFMTQCFNLWGIKVDETPPTNRSVELAGLDPEQARVKRSLPREEPVPTNRWSLPPWR